MRLPNNNSMYPAALREFVLASKLSHYRAPATVTISPIIQITNVLNAPATDRVKLLKYRVIVIPFRL